MRNEKTEMDKDFQRAKEIIFEIFNEMAFPLLIGSLLLIAIASFAHGASTSSSSLVISISYANGTKWINPEFDYANQNNVACADTFTRLKEMCSKFCSPAAKSFYSIGFYWHSYSLSHFDLMRNYPRHWDGWNFTALQAQNHENANIAWYKYFQDSCALCSGLRDVKPSYMG